MSQLTVADIKTKTGEGKGGPYTHYVVTFADGSKASGFEKQFPVLKALKVGDVIEAGTEQDGKYTNFTNIDGVVGHAEKAVAAPAQTSIGNDRNASIERQVSVKIAFENGINEDEETPWTVRKALIQAEQIYQWISTGRLPEVTGSPKQPQQTASQPKAGEQVKGSPFPVDEVLERVRAKKNFATVATVRKWLLDQCGITGEMLEENPDEAWKTVCAIQHWE